MCLFVDLLVLSCFRELQAIVNECKKKMEESQSRAAILQSGEPENYRVLFVVAC